MTRDGLPPLRDVIASYGLAAKKALGQNFLLDLNLTARIARAAGDMTGRTAIEIGPGPGGLTRALLGTNATKVVAVERDERCIEALKDVQAVYPNRLDVIVGDALEIDIIAATAAPRRIVANLPYNVATPLLLGWLRQATAFESMTLMFQKEVADRIVAQPGSKQYGRLSVIAQWLCDVHREFNVDKAAFTPPPKIMSTIVTLTPRETPLAPATFMSLEKITAAAFGQRRKMIRASLKPLNLDLEALGLDPTLRAENLTVEQFCALARAADQST